MLEPIKLQFDRVRWLLHEQILVQLAARDVAGLGASVSSHIDHITEHVAALRRQAPESYFSD